MNLKRLIKNLGSSYDALIDNELIPKLPLQSLYEDSETLEVEPAPGIELIFWPDTQGFEGIQIVLENAGAPGFPVFEGGLPHPFEEVKNQSQVHEFFGKPLTSKSVMELNGTDLYGWETYQLEASWHRAATVSFQYVKGMKISRIQFFLIDRNI